MNNMQSYKSKLELEISILRQKMIDTGQMKGLNHLDTIKCSQELDKILNIYQKFNLSGRDNNSQRPPHITSIPNKKAL